MQWKLFVAALAAAAWADTPGRIVTSARGAGVLTIIDTQTDVPTTVAMPAGANRPEPMYVVYSPVGRRVFVGDRANNRVVVFRARDFSVERTITVGAGVFHMWACTPCRQLWVVNDLDRNLTVIDTVTLSVVTTVPAPADLIAQGGRPHDIIADPVAPFVYVTMIGLTGPEDYVVKYSALTFTEVARRAVGKDPHVSLSWRGPHLYVPSQGAGQVFVLDRHTLAPQTSIAVPGAHGAGMSQSGHRFYTTNFTAPAGAEGLFAINTGSNTVIGSAAVPTGTPHNVAVTPDNRKVYVTHSGANHEVSVYEASPIDGRPTFLRTVEAGTNPFGIEFVPSQSAPPNPRPGFLVRRWVQQALDAVRAQNIATPNAGRLYAMVTAAMFDAVNGIDAASGQGRQHALVPSTGAPRAASRELAAAHAAHSVLTALAPGQAALLNAALDEELALSSVATTPFGTAGIDWGRRVGQDVLDRRAADGSGQAVTIPAGSGPGRFRASFDSRWRFLTPFGVAGIAPFLAPPPPALASPAYDADLAEVRQLGRQDCDPARNDIAQFWLAEAGTVRETGTWLQASLAIVHHYGPGPISEEARLFALLGIAIADSVASSWDTKATYFTWRPTTAIHEGIPDPGWRSRLGAIGGSPEYTSGTSTFAGAAHTVIEAFYCRRDLRFCFETDNAFAKRCYDTPAEAALEAGRSRIYQGIHFQFSNEAGMSAGRAIGREIASTRLQPLQPGQPVCSLP